VKTLSVRDVSRSFGSGRFRRLALQPVNFEASQGEIVGVIGPNGAGKTTLLRLIAGELSPTSGEVLVSGHRSGTTIARRLVGYASDPPLAPPELTGVEWLKYLASHRAGHPGERTRLIRWAVELADLEPFVGRRIAEFSRGMMQRLALAAAALSGRTAVVLDEVLSGVDPLVARNLRAQVSALAAGGRLILIASHDLAALEKIATRVLVMWTGRLAADVSVSALVNERVAELCLTGGGLAETDRIMERFPGSERTGEGVAIPLKSGLTIEKVLAVCRSQRVAVASSRTRYRALEDILLSEARKNGDGNRCK
jgi:ABC-2 type transport system ATP-binding protein